MEAVELRRRARENLANNWGLSIGVAALAWLLGGLISGSSFIPRVQFNLDVSNMESAIQSARRFLFTSPIMRFASILSLAQFILGGVIQLGHARYLLKQHDRQPFAFSDLFSQFERFGQGFAQLFLRNLFVSLWGLLLIIPGIVKSYSYAMTPYILTDHPELTATEAITASREMMDGHKGELFWLRLTFLGWVILSVLTLNLGYLALNPYMCAAEAAFYRSLCAQRQRQI